MIVYDGKKWRSYFRKRGTVLLKALPYAVISSAATAVVKYMDDRGHISLTENNLIKNSAAYGGFTFILSFLLVFRSSQCYNRFWTVAQACCVMRAQFGEATSSLLTFSIITTKTKKDVDAFAHKLVRLTSLLHALCLQNAAEMKDENFAIIDPDGLGVDRLQMLAKMDATKRVDLVYQWIGAVVMHSVKSGLVAAPPPIVSRVFQEFEKAMIEYNQILQVMSIPFPYPYAQVTVLLLFLNMLCTPVVMCHYVGNVVVAALLSFIVILCFVSIELISSELENPLGDDENDLPCHAWQEELNETLLSMLHPSANDDFELAPCAILDDRIFSHECIKPLDSVLVVEDMVSSGKLNGEIISADSNSLDSVQVIRDLANAGKANGEAFSTDSKCDAVKTKAPTVPEIPIAPVQSSTQATAAPPQSIAGAETGNPSDGHQQSSTPSTDGKSQNMRREDLASREEQLPGGGQHAPKISKIGASQNSDEDETVRVSTKDTLRLPQTPDKQCR